MTPELLNYLCEPVTKAPLELIDAEYDSGGQIRAGVLRSPSGKEYPIRNGIPRFVSGVPTSTVTSFGDEWNYFNFVDFKINWLSHTVANTFGSTDVFRNKLIVDAGGGSGSQTRWFLEYGAQHVIMIDLSHSVDNVVQENLSEFSNVDVIQSSIDHPPLRDGSIDGIVYCHNVIQHTPSVERTAKALFACVGPGGEFVFNCYPKNDQGIVRWIRFHLIYKPLRWFLSKMPFLIILFYARLMGLIRLVPVLGTFLERAGFCVQGDVPVIPKEGAIARLIRRFRTTTLNTFDCFGSHAYQHHKSGAEIRALVRALQPDGAKILNMDKYFLRPAPIGCALRIYR